MLLFDVGFIVEVVTASRAGALRSSAVPALPSLGCLPSVMRDTPASVGSQSTCSRARRSLLSVNDQDDDRPSLLLAVSCQK